jgi:dihydroorotate dehydrogenase electron transfer subunit
MLLCNGKFQDLGHEIRIATDDGSCGTCGFVTDLLREHTCMADRSNPPMVYACGPNPMLALVSEIVNACDIECQVSTEAKMACGVGACLSCVVRIRTGNTDQYVRSCKEGPVFNAREVIWD